MIANYIIRLRDIYYGTYVLLKHEIREHPPSIISNEVTIEDGEVVIKLMVDTPIESHNNIYKYLQEVAQDNYHIQEYDVIR